MSFNVQERSKTTEYKFHIFFSQFLTETKLGIDSAPYQVCYFLMRGSPGRSLVIYPTSVLWLDPLRLAEKKMTCLNLEKCDLSFTPLAGICTENLSTVKHPLLSPLFHPVVQNSHRQHQSLD